MAKIKNPKGYPLDLISVIDQGMDGTRQLRSATAAVRYTERWCHGRYSSKAARGLRRAFLDEV
jgi:hypothetical protein